MRNTLLFEEYVGFAAEQLAKADEELNNDYVGRYENALPHIADAIENDLRLLLQGIPHIDRVSARPKSIKSFMSKAQKEFGSTRKYVHPMIQIHDQIGARIVVFYPDDVEKVTDLILSKYKPIEKIDHEPENEKAFGYAGRHMVCFIPKRVMPHGVDPKHCPKFFELQIKTLYQHAWSEASHDIWYKPKIEITSDHERRVAHAASMGWGADRAFNDLKSELGDK